ncbi:hypothetical protein GJ744_011814 [Endocarpon pusillum]|uniref:O-methyltransferase dimerisation domain-containing protein n=1 Tax=Endocarpon pusillum TaxID=364733 RepID=A0A8H7ACI4_9EURO|nr:hypothetical protein GJ744_011814 [Endocarpon pusillum]
MNGSAAEDHFAMNGTVTEDHSVMNGTITGKNPTMNGEDDLAETLEQWSMNLVEAAKAHRGTSGQQSLLLRSKMSNNAKQIIDAIKDPGETPFEYSIQMAEMGALRMMMELKIFDKIPQQGSISYGDLAASIGAEESLLTRFLWMLVSRGLLKQIGEDQVAHTRLSKTYVDGNPQGTFFQAMFDECMPTYTKWPNYFEKFGLKEPREGNYVPMTFALGLRREELLGDDERPPKTFKGYQPEHGDAG